MRKEELGLLLESELEKPEEEMNTELIQRILEYLEPTPSLEQQYEKKKKIKRALIAKGYLFMPVKQ